MRFSPFGAALVALTVSSFASVASAQRPHPVAPRRPVVPPLVSPPVVTPPLVAPPVVRTTAEPRARIYDTQPHRSGPRFGLIWLGGTLTDTVAARDKKISPLSTLFGWQMEREFGDNPNGPTPLTELVVAAAGLEQGTVIPSASWVVGLRMPDDYEFGVGPNFSSAGAALVLTAGYTRHSGSLNIPFNLAVVPSRLGPRISFTTGFIVMD